MAKATARRSPPTTIESSRDRERLRTVVFPEHSDLAARVAERIVEIIQRETQAKGKVVLGLATGSTPLGVYEELIRLHQAGDVDFSHVITFNLDEYYPMSPDSPHSYRRYMWENFFAHVNIAKHNVHIPEGVTPRERVTDACAAYEDAIRAAGGIDFQLLGIGKTGHVGFNEPGSDAASRTRIVTLDTLTRKDVAATFLQRHPSVTFYLDLPAAAELTRIKTPWILEGIDWTPAMVERAVVWLADRSTKAVLKLSARDYAENQLSPLLARAGSAGPINGQVFNRLREKIRGRAKLPAHERVLVFSPHPDDDVISMGGILRKLWENENQMVVAYMTSGNIAVFDHDVTRHLDFVERAAGSLGLDTSAVQRARATVNAGMEQKAPGEIDIPVVQNLKKFIRESEAIAALAAVGIPPTSARFLDLPFYQTGEVRKRPLSEDDIAIVLRLIEETRPGLVFVAGDLSDPHGTHRTCKAAVEAALARYQGGKPEVWLYRGAWQEWSLTEADVLVPLSQDELHAKILAIFRHQSQKDTAPFPGYDEREFWQRVEARNLETAARADRLGLPEYYAMEAYVIQRV